MCEIKYAVKADAARYDAYLGHTSELTPNFTQGTDKNDRIGAKLRYKFLQIKMYLYTDRWNAQAGDIDPNTVIRVVIFQPRLPFTVAPNALNSEIFEESRWNATIKNHTCRVLYDKAFPMCSYYLDIPNHHAPSLRVIKIKRKVNNNVLFRTAGQVLPADPKDKYYLVVTSSTGAANIRAVSHDLYMRLSFIDM